MDSSDSHRVGWELFILVVTIFYLVVETSFSAELLNIVGQHASVADIDHIEHWGRWISGFAAGLLAWTFLPYIPLRRAVAKSLLLFSVLTVAVMVVVYRSELDLVHAMTGESSGLQRKLAVYSVFVRSGLLNGTVQLAGMPSDPDIYGTPEGKTFIALLPLLAHSDSELPDKLEGTLSKLVANQVDLHIGGPGGYFNKVFRPAADHMNQAWLGYRRMIDGLNRAYRRAEANPPWAAQIRQRAEHDFSREVARQFSVPGHEARIDPRSVHDERDFFATPAMTRLWAQALGVKDPGVLLPSASFVQVRREVWPQFRAEQVRQQLAAFMADADAYRDGGSLAQRGRDAMTLVSVPAMALLFSVLGMLVHLGKSAFYLFELTARRRGVTINVLLAMLVSLASAVLFWTLRNPIVTAPLYRHLLAGYAGTNPLWPPWSLSWIIRAEHFVYPVADFLRSEALRGFTFGVTHG